MKSPSLRQAGIFAENELSLLFRQQHEFRRRAYPESATYDGDHRFDDRLTDLSDEASDQRCRKNQAFLAQLRSLDPALLSAASQLNYRLFEQVLEEEIRHHQLGLHLMGIDQQEGMHLRFPQLIEVQPLESYEQYEQYFSRLNSFAKQVEDTLANLRLGLARGLSLPRSVVEQSLSQMQALATCPLETMPLYSPVRSAAGRLSPALAEKVEALARRLILDAVQPAYARLHAYVSQEYLPRCRSTDGVHGLAAGEEIYAYWLARHTAPDCRAEAIHARGLAEVERLLQQLPALQQSLQLPSERRALQLALRTRPDFYYADAPSMLRDYQTMLDQAQSTLPRLFRHLPTSACVLKEIEAWRAAAAPQAYYYPPPRSLNRPGVFYVNCHDLSARPRYGMMALTLHEAVPGHHLQLARALELPEQPEFRYQLEATAMVEGWALYAEALGHPLGLYEQPLQALGALAFELWRACRLVVDTGLHALGWSRQQAVDYFRAHTLQSEADIQSEIDRYLSLPGQALAYKIGELKIWELRRRAEVSLGASFDLRDFHEVLLDQGSLPLNQLEFSVDAWIQRQLAPVSR